jgi:hypothetical protein
MAIKLRYRCKCDSLVTIQKDKPHTCYSMKDHSEDEVKPELTHKMRSLNRGDLCSCGGNQDCRYCGGFRSNVVVLAPSLCKQGSRSIDLLPFELRQTQDENFLSQAARLNAITGTEILGASVASSFISLSISRTTRAEKYLSPQRGQTRAGTPSRIK